MADTPIPRGFTPREASERKASERPKAWQPPQLLPDPHPEDGYTFRWIRIAMLGADDPTNISAKLREGWEPVKASEHPEIQMLPGLKTRFPDSIEIGGLLLCKTPTEFVEQRTAYYAGQNKAQIESVDSTFMRNNDPRMPLFSEKRSEVKFGRGS